MVTTIDSGSPSAERMVVALTSALAPRPSATESATSSARSAGASWIRRNIGTSRPSAKRQIRISISSSGGLPGGARFSTSRLASRLKVVGAPVATSKTTTPTGDVSTSASTLARDRCSLRWVRALAMAVAACDANSTRTSSSSFENSRPLRLPARKKLPRCAPRWRIGVPWKVFAGMRSVEKPSERM